MAAPESSMPILIEMAIEPKLEADRDKLVAALEQVAADDPAFQVNVDPESRQTVLGGISERHLDEKIWALRQAYNLAINVGAPQVAYRETLTTRVEKDYTFKTQTAGFGQFARVKIRFEPTNRGMGSSFEERVRVGAVPADFIPGVAKGIDAVMRSGVLAGFPVVDVRAILLDGAYHDTDSSALTFEIAARLAFREALAEGRSVLLEPWMNVEVTVPEAYAGFVAGDIRSRRGEVQNRTVHDEAFVIRALIPLANMFGYDNQLRSGTQGHGTYVMAYSHCAPVPLPDEDPPPFAPAVGMRPRA